MKQQYIIGNWKSNKTVVEAKQWMYLFAQEKVVFGENQTVVICPPLTILQYVHSYIEANDLPIKVGAQNVSPYDMGAYTGEVTATQVKEFVQYVIIGHSERRQLFKEDDDMLAKKVQLAVKAELQVVFCIQDEKTPVPQGVSVIAYEPVTAIGTGNPDTPENANRVAEEVSKNNADIPVIYGGSVTPDNVKGFLDQQYVSGVLPGGASLDAEKFAHIITYAQKA